MSFQIDDVAEIVVMGNADGQRIYNVLHYFHRQTEPLVDSLNAPDIASAFRSFWQASILPIMPTAYSVDTYRCYIIRSATAAEGEGDNLVLGDIIYDQVGEVGPEPGSVSGALPGDILPTFNNVTVQKRTNIPGRSFRGSVRHAPILEAETTAGAINAPRKTSFEQAWQADGHNITAGAEQFYHGIFRKLQFRSQPGPNITRAVFFITEVLTYKANTNIGSQTSRKRKTVGPT